ncbi:ribonuclease HII [Porticoccus sp. W117]|uniref:ribonuclease HII n=1 Tax=Porticoccus sp. W117 TaxID=3054777 RepID=UPI0025928B38|nr:ribonuclease HII [Porticoccus sp. W117]MDM3870276.1 ribonuclease HII [Porticoccus sp. W117]
MAKKKPKSEAPYKLDYNGQLLAGVDEVGRGPLAGDVVTAAVILDPLQPIEGLGDSKKISEKRREQLYEEITHKALAWCVGRASVAEIDRYNILQATMMAMYRAVTGLSVQPEYVAVDGNKMPKWPYNGETVVKGDAKVAEIGAASIVAKVTRDREMIAFEDTYPGYGFSAHKGYATQQHTDAIRQLGPCDIHRRSFEPVKGMLEVEQLPLV